MICNLLNNNINYKDKNKETTLKQSIIIWELIPTEILNKIFDLIPDIYKITLCKNFYLRYHFILKNYISPTNYTSYLYSIICNDDSFVFERILNENIVKWLHWKDYRDKSVIYTSYLYFIYNMIQSHNCNKCKFIFIKSLEDYFKTTNDDLEKSSFKMKNWFKNNNIKNVKIQWTI